jgi:hypothetical protein
LFIDRLRGNAVGLASSSTSAEAAISGPITSITFNSNTTVTTAGEAVTNVAWNFKRAPGFFDVVCYTGTNVSSALYYHSLGVIPELVIIKNRGTLPGGSLGNWSVAHKYVTNSGFLNTTAAFTATKRILNLTASSFVAAGHADTPDPLNQATTYVAYLFATLAGISKVGSYTGNGSSQNIECGFAAGARFVLIKRTDSTGDWYVWDTARGIVADTEPHLSLNSTAAEVTTDDSIDPYSPGFTVNQVAATNINVTSATYIFLAIS